MNPAKGPHYATITHMAVTDTTQEDSHTFPTHTHSEPHVQDAMHTPRHTCHLEILAVTQSQRHQDLHKVTVRHQHKHTSSEALLPACRHDLHTQLQPPSRSKGAHTDTVTMPQKIHSCVCAHSLTCTPSTQLYTEFQSHAVTHTIQQNPLNPIQSDMAPRSTHRYTASRAPTHTDT